MGNTNGKPGIGLGSGPDNEPDNETNTSKTQSLDYAALGLKCGLEIHQQLGNASVRDRKLFCGCTAEIVEREPDLVIERQLRAIAGETGDIDAAAAAEQAKGKQYTYHAFNDTTCLVELDEEPPHPVDPEAMATAVMVAKAFGSTILPRVQFMRKTVVDGSAVSGFQRTGLLALGGAVPELTPTVRIQTLCVEEDAAKIVERKHDEDIYNLSRLGIPLLEIATEPDITSPRQAQEVAAQIGMVLRSTGRVKRGLGTIRQDVNISIAGGSRVEIKGCQDLRLIPTYVEYEARRQQGLLEVREELSSAAASRAGRGREALFALSSAQLVDATWIFKDSKTGFIRSALAKGEQALGIRLSGFKGLLGRELCPGRRVGSELADLARMHGFGGLIHSDEEMAKYGIADRHADLERAFSLDSDDAFILLLGERGRIARLIDSAIIPRLRQFLVGVPKEVRKANPDGTTSFMRPMPGAARMYPETDIPVVEVRAESVAAPKLLTEQVKDLVARTGISEEQARQLVKEGLPFEEWLSRYPSVGPTLLATALLTYGKEILARYKKEIDAVALLEPVLDAVERKKAPESAVFAIIVDLALGKTTADSIDYATYAGMPEEELRRIVREEIGRAPQLSANGVMGNVMAKARGKADGKAVMRIIEEEKRLLL